MNAMYMIAAATIKAGSGGGEDEHGHSVSDLTECFHDVLKMNIDPK